MNKSTIEMMNDLLDLYEHSKVSKGGSSKNLKITLKSKNTLDAFNRVFFNQDSIFHIDECVADLIELENQKLIEIEYDRYGNVCKILLNLDHADDLYKKLKRENPKIIREKIKTFLANYQTNNEIVKRFVLDEINYIETQYSYHVSRYDNLEVLRDVLKGLEAIYNQHEEIMLRDFSQNIYGDTKIFESVYVNKICSLIKEFDTSNNFADMNNTQILNEFNIVKNSTYALIKNKLNFSLNKQVISLDDLGFEYSLNDQMIKKIKLLPSEIKNVITIENLTSFQMFDNPDFLIIFLSGFHNHTKQMLLEKIYQTYPNANYYHFGDIDVGGFRIFNHLVETTHIPFKPYKMGIKELENVQLLKTLTDNDKKQLKIMLNQPQFTIFNNTIRYMLEHNVKLEQESLD